MSNLPDDTTQDMVDRAAWDDEDPDRSVPEDYEYEYWEEMGLWDDMEAA